MNPKKLCLDTSFTSETSKCMYIYIYIKTLYYMFETILDLYVYVGPKVPHVRDNQPRPTVQSYPPWLYL